MKPILSFSSLGSLRSINQLILVEHQQRRAPKYMCKHSELSYKKRLIYLKLLPINFWLEFLDLVFFFQCKLSQLLINLDDYLYNCSTRTRRAKTGLDPNVQHCKILLDRDSYFSIIVHLWNAIFTIY